MACLEAHHLGRRFPHVNANSEGISMDFSLPCFDSQRVRSQEHRKQISRVSPGCVSARFHTMLEFPNLFYNQERNTTRSASKSNEPCVLQNCSSVRRPRRLSYACEFFKAPVAASWCRNFTQSKGTRELWTKTYHILSVLHLGDKPIFQLAEAAFRSSSSWILGSDFLLPSRAPFAAIWSNASCDFCGGFSQTVNWKRDTTFGVSMDWIEGHLFPVYIYIYPDIIL